MDLNLNNFIWLSLISAVVVFLLLWRYAYYSRLVIHDAQNSRSLHHGKTLTGAGVLMFVPWCLMGLVLAPLFIPFYVILGLTILGFWDDRHDVSFKLRLLVQVFAALLTLYGMGWITPLWLMLLLTFCLLWWVNLFNFMDGANGLAGLHGLVSISFYGWVFSDKFNQVTIFSYMTLACVLVLIVYLVYNMWLKKLFMGDSGSLPLAWIIAVLALYALQTNSLSYAQVALIHAVFITDATMTLMYRLSQGEHVVQAHATHLYQRLIKSGRSHEMISFGYALLTLCCCLLVGLSLESALSVQYAIALIVFLILLTVFMKSLRLGR